MKKNLSYLVMLFFLICAAGAVNYLARAGERERTPARRLLADFPAQLTGWRQIDAQALDARQAGELKADDYISRTYANGQGAIGYLFIAYYHSQRHRQTIHSPQNCIPGSGWTMGRHRLHMLSGNGAADHAEVNEYLIGKDDVKMLAFYWYQGRGRIIASDYWGRFYTIKDALWLGRTDGAIVRVIIPTGKAEGDEERARSAGLDFIRRMTPILSSYIPD